VTLDQGNPVNRNRARWRKKLDTEHYVLWLKRKPGSLADVMDDLHMMYFASE
jgi:hypothetical protein